MTIDGHDVRSVTLESLRRQMGVMLQDTFIFSGNVRENIRYGKLDATDEEIVAAAKAVHAHEFIMELPDGYDTVVEERGSTLSAGQRQLIAFARVLLADPRILILDEATSNIDTRTEEALQAGLNHLLKGRTSFIIAHRLSTIENADEICFIDHGQIVEQGNHAELLARHALLSALRIAVRHDQGLSSRRQPPAAGFHTSWPVYPQSEMPAQRSCSQCAAILGRLPRWDSRRTCRHAECTLEQPVE